MAKKKGKKRKSKRAGAAGCVVKPKRRCCKSSPRCKRCPVVLKRLTRAGLAERRDDGRYLLLDILEKADLKAARR